jgi:hypothetical protein
MEWFDAHISTVDAALEKRPEILKAVGVDAPVYIFNGVIDDRMSVLSSQSLVGEQGVSVESRSSLYMLFDLSLKCRFLAVWDNGCLDLSTALKNAHDSYLSSTDSMANVSGTVA